VTPAGEMPLGMLPFGETPFAACDDCGARRDAIGDVNAVPNHATCVACGGLLAIVPQRPGCTGRELADSLDTAAARAAGGVWRFGALVHPSRTPVSWPEGDTPLVTSPALSAFAGLDNLSLKHEGMNPTGSFKDRGMTVAITDAVARRARGSVRAVACASTGNTAASLAAYAARAGLPALVFVPAGNVASGKLAQATAYGARTLLVRADFDACLALAREASHSLGVYLANSVNPWRLEGQKTIAWELLAQRDWRAPDWIALPGGALGNTSAFGKALSEARALGLIDRVPRLLVVQAAGAAPFAAAFANGFRERVTVRAETVATAIRIGAPASWDRAVRAIRDTNGVVLAVDDAAILDAKAAVDAAGIGCEPASAASVAGVRAARARGLIAADDSVVAVLTGHLLKDPDTVMAYHAGGSARANAPIAIEPTIAAVDAILSSL